MLTRIHPSFSLLLFLVGVVAGGIFTLASRVVFISHPLFVIAATILLFITFFRPVRVMLALSFLAGVVCINYRASFDLLGQDYFQDLSGETITITGTITRDPDTSDSATALRLSRLSTPQGSVPGTLYVRLGPNTTLQRSDIITLTGKVSPGFGTFAAALYRPTISSIERPSPGDVFLTVRNWFSENIKQHLSSEESALGLGYLLGMRSSLPAGLDEKLRTVGLTHIIVTSGAHLSILIGFSRKFFGKISRFSSVFISVFLVLGYIGIVGFTPSMARAGLVSILSLLTWYVGREFRPARLLLTVAAITLLINPMYLIDLGWLLSFAAFAGIMILGPRLTQFFYGESSPNFLAAIIIETISASLLCTPILLYFFGSVSLISLVANLLIPPTISVAMALTFLTGALFFAPPAAALFGKLSALVLEYHLAVINFLGDKDMFLIQIPAENVLVFLLYIPVALPFIVKKLYNIIKCVKKPLLRPKLKC